NTENRREMARRGVKHRFWKQERTSLLRASLNDIAVKTFGINHAPISDSEDERSPFSLLRIELYSRSPYRIQTCCCGESRNRTRTAEARMGTSRHRPFRYAEDAVKSISELFGNFCRGCRVATKQLLPY